MYPSYPSVGKPVLLVYRECPCGAWCATGEGAGTPTCSGCGGWYLPGGGPAGQFGPSDGSDPQYGRRTRGLGFVAVLMGEQAASGWLHRLRCLLWGAPAPAFAFDDEFRTGRYYSEREIEGRMAEMSARETEAR